MKSPSTRKTAVRHLLWFLLLSTASAATFRAQEPPSSTPAAEVPLLTLEDAVSLALGGNRNVKNSGLEVQKSEDRLDVARSQRLPRFQVDVLAGSLLHPIDFTFPSGSFGSYPGIGPVPATDSAITTPAQFVTFTTAAFDQPLTQQYKIHLTMRATELGLGIAREDLRSERQKVADDVRRAYTGLVATQAAVESARNAVTTLTEVQRVTAEHEAQHTVLRADALEVAARLGKSRYDLLTAEDRLETQQELLNDLLGRDLSTPFRVQPMPEEDAGGLTLESARERASALRPEIRQAQFKEQQAEVERRLAKAEYIPDLSFSVRHVGFENFEVLPTNVTTAGLYLTWEPFDWGRRAHKVSEKRAAVEQAHNGALQTHSEIAIDVGSKYRGWSEAALLVQAARTGTEAAREQLRIVADKYKEQASLLQDLLQAQTRSTEAEFQYQHALATYWSALADLRRAMGDE